MASVIRDPNGRKRISFRENGRTKQIRLGKATVKQAEAFRVRVEGLLAAKLQGLPPDGELSAWLAGLGDTLHDRLVRVGLAQPRRKVVSPTLAELLDRFVASATVKPATLAAYRQTTNSLRKHLGERTPIDAITPEDADRWRRAIVDEGLAGATVAKRCHVAKAIFKRAVRWGLLQRSPFEGLRTGSQSNPERSVYVPREVVAAVLDACPDDRWRAVVALCRFAGLRCPSEVARLTWADVHWEKGRLTVRSPKTEGREGRAVRLVPISPELRPILLRLFEQARAGDERVIHDLDAAKNLRTTFQKIIARASCAPWPRLFQNLRASCATDWVERFPAHAVARWLGHSPMIAAQHYLHVRDRHFEEAAGLVREESGANLGADGAQNAALHTTGGSCAGAHESRESSKNSACVQSSAGSCKPLQNRRMGDTGLEPVTSCVSYRRASQLRQSPRIAAA